MRRPTPTDRTNGATDARLTLSGLVASAGLLGALLAALAAPVVTAVAGAGAVVVAAGMATLAPALRDRQDTRDDARQQVSVPLTDVGVRR